QIYSSGERENHSTPIIVYSIWANHAFFYGDGFTKHGAAQLPTGPERAVLRASQDAIRLRTAADEDQIVPYVDMIEYSLDALRAKIQANKSATFFCYPSTVKEVKAEIEAAKEPIIPIWTGLGHKPETIVSLNVCAKNKTAAKDGPKIRVKVVPENANALEQFCVTFRKKFELKLVYNGEGMSGLMHKAFKCLAVTRRPDVLDRAAVRNRQDGKCACCQDSIVKIFEVDHIKPLCQGGSNDLSNLQALCKQCHAHKTQLEERNGTRTHTVESHLSPKLWRDLHKAPKPMEISWGKCEEQKVLKRKIRSPKMSKEEHEKKTTKFRTAWAKKQRTAKKMKNIKDLLLKKAKPQTMIVTDGPKLAIPAGVSILRCMDARSCRVFALTKRTRG
ncbi:MAG: HNH endonuclease, partial [Acidobacteria bacterium]|nr:HNH endonuclease [Acidobacteriota bacterium]